MDKVILKDLFLRNWKNLVILFFAILLWWQCNKSDELLLSSELSKSKAKDYLQQSRLASKNLQGITAKYQSKIDSVVKIENEYKNQLAQNSKTVKAKLSDLKKFSSTEITEYYKDRYNNTKDIIQSELGTTLKDTVSRLVITDLVVGDGAKAEVKILREVVQTKDEKFKICNETVDSLKVGIESMIKNYELANSQKDNAIKQTEKALKKEKHKKNAWKLLSGATLAGIGYLLFVK
jgi:hypothetical protein